MRQIVYWVHVSAQIFLTFNFTIEVPTHKEALLQIKKILPPPTEGRKTKCGMLVSLASGETKRSFSLLEI